MRYRTPRAFISTPGLANVWIFIAGEGGTPTPTLTAWSGLSGMHVTSPRLRRF
jgi:hypothetical protein